MPLTHFDAEGQAHMVDVSDKAVTDRVAVATGAVRMAPATLAFDYLRPWEKKPPYRTADFLIIATLPANK